VDSCGGLGNGAVVELDLLRSAFKDDAGGDTGAGRDVNALCGSEVTGANGYRNVYGDVAGVVDVDGDEPADADAVTGGDIARGDVGDGEVGEAAVMVDPVIEELGEVFVGGSFEDALEGVRVFGGTGVSMADLVAIELEGVFESSISGDRAKHEEDGRRLSAVVDLVVGGDEALSRLPRLRGGWWEGRWEWRRWGGSIRLGWIGGA
jgi:hypothetical protein